MPLLIVIEEKHGIFYFFAVYGSEDFFAVL